MPSQQRKFALLERDPGRSVSTRMDSPKVREKEKKQASSRMNGFRPAAGAAPIASMSPRAATSFSSEALWLNLIFLTMSTLLAQQWQITCAPAFMS